MLVVTLPRQIQMIQNMEIIVQHISEWTDIKQRLQGLKRALDVKLQNPEQRIQWDKIQFYCASQLCTVQSIESLQSLIQTPKRITFEVKMDRENLPF